MNRATKPLLAGISDNRVVTAPVRRTMISLALPVVAEQTLNTLVGLVDTFLAGQLPTDSVAATSAVGLAAYVGWLVSMLFALVATGTTALVARACGAGDRSEASAVTNQSMLLAAVMGTAGAVAMYALAPHFGAWLHMTAATNTITVHYLRIDALSYAAWALTLVGSAALRGAGDMRTPLKVLTLVNIFNVILSPVLVYGVGPAPVCGVDGIVLGTLCSRIVGGALIVVVLLRGGQGLVLDTSLLRPAFDLIRRILRIGVPAAVDGAIMWTGHFCFLKIVGHLDQLAQAGENHAFAAQIVVVRLEAFTYLPASAWAAACATMIGQSLGAGLPERAKRCGHEGALQCGLLTALVGGFFVVFAPQLCGLMQNDPKVLALAAPILRLAGCFQPVLALAITYTGALRGAGDTVYPMLCNATGLALVRIPFGYLLGVHYGLGLLGAWYAVFADLVIRMILALVRFARGKWVAIRV